MIDFGLTEEQKMLRASARDFLSAKCPDGLVRDMMKDDTGYSPRLWREMAGAGWLGLALPEEYGGSGAGLLDLGVLAEEMGRVCLPAPFFTSSVFSAMLLLEGNNEAKKKELLPAIAAGDRIVATALTEGAEIGTTRVSSRATANGSGYIIEGVALPVPYAHVADDFVCAARTPEGIILFLVDARSEGLKRTPMETIVGDKQFRMDLSGVEAGRDDIVGDWATVERVLPRATIIKCLEMVGGAQRVVEMTVEYARTRRQFGHPIGSYQAIQHRCADMALAVDAARFLACHAAWMLEQGLQAEPSGRGLPAATAVAMAKSRISQVYRQVTFDAHQIHGAIAFCEDHSLPLYIKRAKEAEEVLGTPDYHLETVAKGLGL